MAWQGTYNAGALYAAGDWVGYAGTVWVALQVSTGQTPSPGAYWRAQAVAHGPEPAATTTSEGVVELTGDLGGTAADPQVVALDGGNA